MVRKKILALGLSSGSLLACRESMPQTESVLQIHNGVEVNNDQFDAVVLLTRVEAGTQTFCTGVFVNEFQVLTAAHCVDGTGTVYLARPTDADQNQAGFEVLSQALRTHIHPAYAADNGPTQQTNDLALVDFPSGLAPDFIELATEPASDDSEVTLVGFGSTQVKPGLHAALTPDKKRSGSNILRNSESGMHTASGMPQRSKASINAGKFVSSGSGDSGSPWLQDGKIVSLTVGAELKAQSNGTWLPISYAVDVTSPSNREFLATWID